MTTTNEQQTIKNWFDSTYSKRGESYLRPKEAYYIFAELLKLKSGKNFLDVACGLGRMLEISADYGVNNHGIDLSEVAITKAKNKLPNAVLLEANAESIPFNDEHFDYVTCLGSLERMIDKNKVLREIRRVTKPEATLCFMVRNSNSWRWIFTKKLLYTINRKGHQDAKTYKEWEWLFEQNDLKIVQCIPDQWPVMKGLRLLTFGRFNGFKSIQKSITPLQFANEFIFILQKK
ncbi:MAG: class I SAM-dependent methyltransferase [Flavobacterium sp.]|uniref:class I SAM-dependent methyltransferase n=1 Tax=Flavobacterium sp. TaxID=239 RepID=UPI00391C625C